MLFPLCRLFFLGHFSFLSCWCQSEVQCLQGVCACCNCIIIAARDSLWRYGASRLFYASSNLWLKYNTYAPLWTKTFSQTFMWCQYHFTSRSVSRQVLTSPFSVFLFSHFPCNAFWQPLSPVQDILYPDFFSCSHIVCLLSSSSLFPHFLRCFSIIWTGRCLLTELGACYLPITCELM